MLVCGNRFGTVSIREQVVVYNGGEGAQRRIFLCKVSTCFNTICSDDVQGVKAIEMICSLYFKNQPSFMHMPASG
jgi:hypothetical protein